MECSLRGAIAQLEVRTWRVSQQRSAGVNAALSRQAHLGGCVAALGEGVRKEVYGSCKNASGPSALRIGARLPLSISALPWPENQFKISTVGSDQAS